MQGIHALNCCRRMKGIIVRGCHVNVAKLHPIDTSFHTIADDSESHKTTDDDRCNDSASNTCNRCLGETTTRAAIATVIVFVALALRYTVEGRANAVRFVTIRTSAVAFTDTAGWKELARCVDAAECSAVLFWHTSKYASEITPSEEI